MGNYVLHYAGEYKQLSQEPVSAFVYRFLVPFAPWEIQRLCTGVFSIGGKPAAQEEHCQSKMRVEPCKSEHF